MKNKDIQILVYSFLLFIAAIAFFFCLNAINNRQPINRKGTENVRKASDLISRTDTADNSFVSDTAFFSQLIIADGTTGKKKELNDDQKNKLFDILKETELVQEQVFDGDHGGWRYSLSFISQEGGKKATMILYGPSACEIDRDEYRLIANGESLCDYCNYVLSDSEDK